MPKLPAVGKPTVLFMALLGTTMANPAMAQDVAADGSGSSLDLEGGIDLVSDYRFRGVSLSDRDPAIQPWVKLSLPAGLYASAWGSNVAENGGDDLELDLAVGYGFSVSGLEADIGVTYYVYPGVSDTNYAEVIGSLSSTIGSTTVTGTAAYAPDQDALGEDNLYLGAALERPVIGPLSANIAFGWEDGAFGDDKLDWQVGVSGEFARHFSAGISYVDSHRAFAGSNGEAGVVLSLGAAF